MAPNFSCKLSCIDKVACRKKFTSRVKSHVGEVINFMIKRHFELSTGDAIMNVDVFRSLCFA